MGGERGQAVLDLLMHPRARALMRAETDVVLAFPRVVLSALVTRPARALCYSGGDHMPVLALAFTPPLVVEGAIVHLLVPGEWLLVHVVTAIAHSYALLWLLSWGFGSRAYPHRLGRRALVARNGPLYRACVPLDAVAGAVARRERAGTTLGVPDGLVLRDGAALLPSRGRVDVWLELDRPVLVKRPLGEPVAVTRIALASDDPDELVRRLAAAPAPVAPGDGRAALSALGGLELAGGLRDVLQPA